MDNKTTKWRKKPDQNTVVRERGAHVDNGWPHYSRINGLCMCLDTCCQGERGCKCKSCLCRRLPEWHTERRPLPLPLVDITSSTGKDGITNGLPKHHANGGRKGNGKGTADTTKNRLHILRSMFRNSNSMCHNRHSDRT